MAEVASLGQTVGPELRSGFHLRDCTRPSSKLVSAQERSSWTRGPSRFPVFLPFLLFLLFLLVFLDVPVNFRRSVRARRILQRTGTFLPFFVKRYLSPFLALLKPPRLELEGFGHLTNNAW